MLLLAILVSAMMCAGELCLHWYKGCISRNAFKRRQYKVKECGCIIFESPHCFFALSYRCSPRCWG